MSKRKRERRWERRRNSITGESTEDEREGCLGRQMTRVHTFTTSLRVSVSVSWGVGPEVPRRRGWEKEFTNTLFLSIKNVFFFL